MLLLLPAAADFVGWLLPRSPHTTGGKTATASLKSQWPTVLEVEVADAAVVAPSCRYATSSRLPSETYCNLQLVSLSSHIVIERLVVVGILPIFLLANQ